MHVNHSAELSMTYSRPSLYNPLRFKQLFFLANVASRSYVHVGYHFIRVQCIFKVAQREAIVEGGRSFFIGA